MIYGPITTPAAAGGAGAAAATVVTPTKVSGLVLGIAIQYNDAPPATTDVGIKTKSDAGKLPNIPLLTLSNANTDGYFVPKAGEYTAAGASTGGYAYFAIDDYVQIDLAQANDGDTVSVWLYMG